jgi:hypothetical protein
VSHKNAKPVRDCPSRTGVVLALRSLLVLPPVLTEEYTSGEHFHFAQQEELIDRGVDIHRINAGLSDQAGILPLYIFGPDSPVLPMVRTDSLSLSRRLQKSAAVIEGAVRASELFGKTEIFLVEASIGQADFANAARRKTPLTTRLLLRHHLRRPNRRHFRRRSHRERRTTKKLRC